jgi:hypothetical protein
VAAIIVAGAIVVWAMWASGTRVEPTPMDLPADPPVQAVAPSPGAPAASQPGSEATTQGATNPQGDPSGASAPTDPPAMDAPEAAAAIDSGMRYLKAGELISARTELNNAYYSDGLTEARKADLRAVLTDLAERTLIGAGSAVFEDDPYAEHYTCRPGDVLALIERRQRLHVPWQLLIRVNNMRRPEDLEAGRTYKLVHGPFHAVICKGDFLMDIFLQREDKPRVFVKRMRIGTGRNGSTPVGMWRVRLGGKNERPTWYPPPNSIHRGPIAYGQPDYAFGVKGLWIGLEGLDGNTAPLTDYGIHSTNSPDSIGRAESLGCIRLADDDIELAYTLLYEHWSTVEVRP